MSPAEFGPCHESPADEPGHGSCRIQSLSWVSLPNPSMVMEASESEHGHGSCRIGASSWNLPNRGLAMKDAEYVPLP